MREGFSALDKLVGKCRRTEGRLVQGMAQHNDLLLCLQMFFAVIRHLLLLIWLLPHHTQSLGDRGTIFLNDDILKGWLPGP